MKKSELSKTKLYFEALDVPEDLKVTRQVLLTSLHLLLSKVNKAAQKIRSLI